LAAILEGMTELQELRLGRCSAGVCDDGVERMALALPRLEMLDLSGCTQVSDASARMLSLRARRLHTILLSGLPKLTDEGCHRIHERPRTNSPWRRIDLSRCPKIGDSGVLAVLSDANQLEQFGAAHLTQLTDLAMVGVRLPRLKEIDLEGTLLGDEALTWIASGAPVLEDLRLRNCRKVTAPALALVAEKCASLRRLDVRGIPGMAPGGVEGFAAGLGPEPQLETLLLDGVTQLKDPALQQLAAAKPAQLRELSIPGGSRTSDRGLVAVAEACPRLQLVRLNFDKRGGTPSPFTCPKITDATLLSLGRSCHELTHLTVSGCHRLTDRGIRSISSGCRRIRVLRMSAVTAVSDEALVGLALHCADLRELAVPYVPAVTDTGIEAVAAGCPRLERLIVSGCAGVSDRSLVALSRTCVGLRELRVAACPVVTDTGLRLLASRCWRINVLSIAGCETVTSAGISAVARRCRGLHTLFAESCSGATDHVVAAAAAILPLGRVSDTHHGLEPSCGSSATLAVRVKVLDAELRYIRAVMRLQALWRTRLHKWLLNRTLRARAGRDAARRFAASVVIQRHVRGWLARLWWQGELRATRHAASQIQGLFRMRAARNEVQTRHSRAEEARAAATVLQCWWRAILARRRARVLFTQACARMLEDWLPTRSQKHQAAAVIRRACLYQHDRRFALRLYEASTELAVLLQRRFRGAEGRRTARKRRSACDRVVMWALKALKHRRARLADWRHHMDASLELQAALVLQPYARQFVARVRADIAAAQRREQRALVAAACERAILAMKGRRAAQVGAAHILQRVFRGHRGRVAMSFIRRAARHEMLRHNAARMMQRAWRAKQYRRRVIDHIRLAGKLVLMGWDPDTVANRLRRLQRNGAAAVVQRVWHRFTRRKEAATAISASWRGWTVRRWYGPWSSARVACAVKIQAAYRRRALLFRLHGSVFAVGAGLSARRQVLQHAAATAIQSAWRASVEARERAAVLEAETFLHHEMEQLRRRRAQDLARPKPEDEPAERAAVLDVKREERKARAAAAAVAASPFFRIASRIQSRLRGEREDEQDGKRGRGAPVADGSLTRAELEEQSMEQAVRQHMRRAVQLEAVSALFITVGQAECDEFGAKQTIAARMGRPAFERIKVDLSAPIGNADMVRQSLDRRRQAVRAAAAGDGLVDDDVERKVSAWETHRHSPAKAQRVFLWVKSQMTKSPLSDIRIHEVWRAKTRDELFELRAAATRAGDTVIAHSGEGTRLELLSRTRGARTLTAIAAAPVSPGHPRTMELRRMGMRPLGIDLSEVGLAEGLQLWVREEGGGAPVNLDPKLEELKSSDFWSPDLLRVITMLQLTAENVRAWHDAFCMTEADGDGLVGVSEFVRSLGAPLTPFSQHFARFMGAGDAEGKLSFGQWARVTSGVALLDERQLAALVFSFLDIDGVGAVTLAALGDGAREILRTASAGANAADIVAHARRLPRDRMGLISAPAFVEFVVSSQPALLYPAARMQDAIKDMLMGRTWWERKRARFAEIRIRLRRTRDLAHLASTMPGHEGDPDALLARYVEVCAERAPLVAQCFASKADGAGHVAILVPHAEEAAKWANRRRRLVLPGHDRLRALADHPPFQRAMLDAIAKEQLAANIPPAEAISQVVVVPQPFTVENHMLEAELAGDGGGPGAPHGLPDRAFLSELYAEEIDAMADAARKKTTAAQKLAHGVTGGLRVAGSVAGQIGRGLWSFVVPEGPRPEEREASAMRKVARAGARAASAASAAEGKDGEADGGGVGSGRGTPASATSAARSRIGVIEEAGGVAAVRMKRGDDAERRRRAMVEARAQRREWKQSLRART